MRGYNSWYFATLGTRAPLSNQSGYEGKVSCCKKSPGTGLRMSRIRYYSKWMAERQIVENRQVLER